MFGRLLISYAREDLTHAMEMANILGSAGISYWIDKQRISWGNSFLNEISTGLVEAKAVVLILSTSAVKSPWVETEVTDAKGRNIPILPLKVEEFEIPRPWRLLLAHHQWEETIEESLARSSDKLLEIIRTALLNNAAQLPDEYDVNDKAPAVSPEPEGVNPDSSPYVGPRPFTHRMTANFFGRHREAQILLKLISSSRIVLVYAPSGSGKSSLLNTVITQSLDDQGLDVMLGARPGGALPPETSVERIRNVFSFSTIYGLDRSEPPRVDCRLSDYLKSISRKRGTRGRVIIFDQFEEIFTQHRERFEDRAKFLEEVLQSLHDDESLRVIFALRQEFLADIEALLELLPADESIQRFALKHITNEGALEAIKKPAEPYAKYEDGVAEKILEQLNTIRIKMSDGRIVDKPGEFIEMVHLQIVCNRLWSRLPRGIKSIGMDHVKETTGEKQTVRAFVKDALNAFYDETIAKVAESATTQAHGGFSKELIQLGCMKFVTSSSTRTLVHSSRGRIGRLPDWIVSQLENNHLLRAEQRGGQCWYELSHDRLAEPVGRKIDRDVSSLLFASDLLDKVIENVTQGDVGGLKGYFEEHRDVLAECRPFQEYAGLFEDEAEFVLRASLTAGQEAPAWSKRISLDYPKTHLLVLEEALSSASDVVRCNTLRLLGYRPVDDVLHTVIELSVSDTNRDVRREAAIALAYIDNADLYRELYTMMHQSANDSFAVEALSRIQITVDGFQNEAQFIQSRKELRAKQQQKISRKARRVRFREGLAVFPFVFVPAAFLAAVAAASFKWIPGIYNYALSQATASAAMGVFHGVVAGVVWAGFITLGITYYDVVFYRGRAPKSAFRPVGVLLCGAASGLISSALIVTIVISVYELNSLAIMGWISNAGVTRFSSEFFYDLFVQLRYAWVYLITGTGLGVGMGLVSNALRSSPEWEDLQECGSNEIASLTEVPAVLRKIMRLVLPRVWMIPLLLCMASIAAFFVPETEPGKVIGLSTLMDSKANSSDLVAGLVGDGITQALGAYFGICGMALGVVFMRRGLFVKL